MRHDLRGAPALSQRDLDTLDARGRAILDWLRSGRLFHI